jgi:hypothetical protein
MEASSKDSSRQKAEQELKSIQEYTNKALKKFLYPTKLLEFNLSSGARKDKSYFILPDDVLNNQKWYTCGQNYFVEWNTTQITVFRKSPGLGSEDQSTDIANKSLNMEKYGNPISLDKEILGQNAILFDHNEESIIVITESSVHRFDITKPSFTSLGSCENKFERPIHSIKFTALDDKKQLDDYKNITPTGIIVEYGQADRKVAHFHTPTVFRGRVCKAPANVFDELAFAEKPGSYPREKPQSTIIKHFVRRLSPEMAKRLKSGKSSQVFYDASLERATVLCLNESNLVEMTQYKLTIPELKFDEETSSQDEEDDETLESTEIGTAKFDKPVFSSLFSGTQICNDGFLLVAEPLGNLGLISLELPSDQSALLPKPIITFENYIKSINSVAYADHFKYIIVNANSGQLFIWAKSSDNKPKGSQQTTPPGDPSSYGLIYYDDDPAFTKTTKFTFTENLEYILCHCEDKILKFLFKPYVKPSRLVANSHDFGRKKITYTYPLSHNRIVNVSEGELEVKDLVQSTSYKLVLSRGWRCDMRIPANGLVLLSRKDTESATWYLSVICVQDDSEQEEMIEVTDKSTTLPHPSPQRMLMHNLIFVISLALDPTPDHLTTKSFDRITLHGKLSAYEFSPIFFDGNLLGAYDDQSKQLEMYDADFVVVDQEEKEKSKSPSILRSKKQTFDLELLADVLCIDVINFGKDLIVFKKSTISTPKKVENEKKDEENELFEDTKKKLNRKGQGGFSSRGTILGGEEVEEKDDKKSSIEGIPESDEYCEKNSFVAENDKEIFVTPCDKKGHHTYREVAIFSMKKLVKTTGQISELISHGFCVDAEQDRVRYSNTGKYLVFFGKGFTLMQLNKDSKYELVKRRLNQAYTITDYSQIQFSKDDKFMAIAFPSAGYVTLFNLDESRKMRNGKQWPSMQIVKKNDRISWYYTSMTFIHNSNKEPKYLAVTDTSKSKDKNQILFITLDTNNSKPTKYPGPTFDKELNPVLVSATLDSNNALLNTKIVLITGRYEAEACRHIRMIDYDFVESDKIPFQYFIQENIIGHFDLSNKEILRKTYLKMLDNIIKALRDDQILIDPRLLYLCYAMDKPELIEHICKGEANLNAFFKELNLLQVVFCNQLAEKKFAAEEVVKILKENIKNQNSPTFSNELISEVIRTKNENLISSSSCRDILSLALFSDCNIEVQTLVKDRYNSLVKMSTPAPEVMDSKTLSDLIEPIVVKRDKNQKYHIYASKVEIDLTNGSESSLGLIEAIMLMPDEELRYKYKQLITHKWSMVYKYIYLYMFLYITLNILVYIHFGYSSTDKLALSILLLNFFFLLYDILCFSSEIKLFIRDLNYWLDVIVHGVCITALVFMQFGIANEVHDYARLAAISAVSIRGISLLKMFGPLRILVKMIGEILYDLKWVPLVLGAIILLAATLYKVTPLPGGNHNAHLNFWESIQQVFLLMFIPSQANQDNISDKSSTAGIIRSVIILIAGGILAQCIFNIVIAMIIGTFTKVQKDREVYEIRSMMLDIRDIDMVLRRFHHLGILSNTHTSPVYYLFMVPVLAGDIVFNINRFDKINDIIEGIGGEIGKRSLVILEEKLEDTFPKNKVQIEKIISGIST